MAGYFNGAMTKDLNKGITEIQYNSLNLPRLMIFNSPSVKAKNYYTYSASGVKLKTEQRYDPNYTVTPSNATSPANDGLSDYKNTDYVGNIIYEKVKSGSVITNKMRILVDGGYIENGVYHYYLNDHLGNNRVVANSSGTVMQSNHYYPFGSSFADTPMAEQGKQPYKYNGKELDMMPGLNMYDYLARHLALDVPRFTTVDPLAKKYYLISPYAYCANNPLRFIDPTGMDWYEDEKGNVMWQEGNDKTVTKTYEGENGSITVNYRNVGTSYTVNVDDNVSIRYEQNEIDNVLYLDNDLKNINPQLSTSTKEATLVEKWSGSNNFFAKLTYKIANDAYVTIQPFTFGLVGETTNELTGGIAHTNLDGTTNYKGIESFINISTTVIAPTAIKVTGSTIPKGLLYVDYKHTGSLYSGFVNYGIGSVNSQLSRGNITKQAKSIGNKNNK